VRKGDAYDLMTELAAESVGLIITPAPYWGLCTSVNVKAGSGGHFEPGGDGLLDDSGLRRQPAEVALSRFERC
jgi:hypothetical protein